MVAGRGGGGGGGECGGKKRKGLWTEKEDKILREYISVYGEGKWNRISKLTGLKRSGKSCRLRWMNYLTPNVKKDDFSHQEEDLIIRLHNLLGNRWSLIAGRIPGRTDNQVKNHWNNRLSKKLGRIQKAKTSCIPLSNELQCTKGQEISTILNHCPPNSSSNLPIFHHENGEIDRLLMPVEEDGSNWNTEFGTNSTIQEADQMMNEYSNLNSYSNLSPIDGCPFDVVWDELWLY